MLTLVRSTSDNRRFQRQLVIEIRSSLGRLGTRLVTYRPQQIPMTLYGFGHSRLYFATERQNDRFWNAFGVYDETEEAQDIVVEINVSFGVDRRTAGFFARDASGRVFLMHSGRIGGGRVGIGQGAFFAWYKPKLVPVYGLPQGAGIVVGELGSDQLPSRIEAFVRSVARFKAFISSGEIEVAQLQTKAEQWREYRNEFRGHKHANYDVDLDYVSYHGEVVDSVRDWVLSKAAPESEVTNSPLIDLLVHRDGTLTHVFEIKTGGSRQSLYAGLGQLIVHSSRHPDSERWLVVAKDTEIPDDILYALKSNAVSTLRFKLSEAGAISIVG